MASPKTILQQLIFGDSISHNGQIQIKIKKYTQLKDKRRRIQKPQSRQQFCAQLKINSKNNTFKSESTVTKLSQSLNQSTSLNCTANSIQEITTKLNHHENNFNDHYYQIYQPQLKEKVLQCYNQITNFKNDLTSIKTRYMKNLNVELKSLQHLHCNHNNKIYTMLQYTVMDNELAAKVNQLISLYHQNIGKSQLIDDSFKNMIEQLDNQLGKHLNDLQNSYIQQLIIKPADSQMKTFEISMPNSQHATQLDKQSSQFDEQPYFQKGQRERLTPPQICKNNQYKKQQSEQYNICNVDTNNDGLQFQTPECRQQNFAQRDHPPENQHNEIYFNEQCEWKVDLYIYSINQAFLKNQREIQQLKQQMMKQYHEICQLLNYNGQVTTTDFLNVTYILPLA